VFPAVSFATWQAKATAAAKVEEKKPEKVEVVKADAKADANAKVGFLWHSWQPVLKPSIVIGQPEGHKKK
jgi:hypothetical protein